MVGLLTSLKETFFDIETPFSVSGAHETLMSALNNLQRSLLRGDFLEEKDLVEVQLQLFMLIRFVESGQGQSFYENTFPILHEITQWFCKVFPSSAALGLLSFVEDPIKTGYLHIDPPVVEKWKQFEGYKALVSKLRKHGLSERIPRLSMELSEAVQFEDSSSSVELLRKLELSLKKRDELISRWEGNLENEAEKREEEYRKAREELELDLDLDTNNTLPQKTTPKQRRKKKGKGSSQKVPLNVASAAAEEPSTLLSKLPLQTVLERETKQQAELARQEERVREIAEDKARRKAAQQQRELDLESRRARTAAADSERASFLRARAETNWIENGFQQFQRQRAGIQVPASIFKGNPKISTSIELLKAAGVTIIENPHGTESWVAMWKDASEKNWMAWFHGDVHGPQSRKGVAAGWVKSRKGKLERSGCLDCQN